MKFALPRVDSPLPAIVAPRSPRRTPRRAALVLLMLGALLGSTRPARAGWDDFEFGQKLIERGYLDFAKRVYEGMLANPKSTAADKDRARFGMALLGKADLTVAQNAPTTPFTTITQKLDAAAGQIQDFISKNGADAKVNDAKMALGNLHSGFVQWCATLVDMEDDWQRMRAKEREDNKGRVATPADVAAANEASPLEARGATAAKVREAAADSNRRAEEVFVDLKANGKAANQKATDELRQLAEFHYLTALYFKGLTFDKCKPEAISAFQAARKALDDYSIGNEQYITGTYALDFLGKVSMELADCENDSKAQLKGYRDALEYFLAAANAGDQGDEHRKLMCTGFLHIAQLGLHLSGGERKTDPGYRAVLKNADQELAKLVKESWLQKYKPGLYGMISWAEFMALAFENRRGEAIEILRQTSDAAAKSGFDDVKRRADAALRRLVKMGGSRDEVIDVGIVIKVADDLFANGKFADAISAYQKVVAGAPKDRDGLVKYYLYGWGRIGACYTQLKLFVEAAAAFDVIADEFRAGRTVPTSQEDAIGKIMIEAFNKERAALKEVSERTGDPIAKKRLDAFTDWQIRAINGIPSGTGTSGQTGNLAYGRALETFKTALRAKETTPNGTEWRTSLKESLQFFEQTAGDFKNEYQDIAWVYIVRVAFEAGDWDGVATAAVRAAAFWESPEAKKRAAAEPTVGANRPAQLAAVDYWKAAAFVGAKKDADAMSILEGFKAKYGKDASFYLGWAMGMRVEILLRRGNIEEAESAINELIRDFPDYHKLPGILIQQAEYYRGKESEIQKQIDAITVQEIGDPTDRTKGIRSQLRSLSLEENNLVNVSSDQLGIIERADAVIASSKATEGEKKKAREDKAAAEARLREAKTRLEKVKAEIKTLVAKQAELAAAKTALLRAQVVPLRKAAELYRKLDVLFKDLDSKAAPGTKPKRRQENVSVLAFRYYKLAKIEDTDADAWETAKALYDDWLAFPDVKALPETDAAKRRSYRLLGEIYYRVAATQKAPDEQRLTYQRAVRFLEDGLARVATNTPILLGNLAGELVVLPYRDGNRPWKIPVRKVADVKEFRDYVKDLLGGGKLPKYVRDTDQALYEKAISAFQRKIVSMSDAELAGTVTSLKTGGFDVGFFSEHVDTDPTLILALAQAYRAGEQSADAMKAINVLRVLTEGPQKLDDDSGDWWEVQTVGLEIRVSAAERALQSGGAASPEAKNYTSMAQKMIAFTKQNYPHIGGFERHEQTLAEWIAIQGRVTVLAGKLGLPSQSVDLRAEAAPAAPVAPPIAPPADPTPAPMDGEPAMNGEEK